MRRRNGVGTGVLEGRKRALLTIAAERQVWHRSLATPAGERAPAGRIHAVLGTANTTLCGLHDYELAQFPYLDFTDSTLPRCEVCRQRGAAILH
jgi:hypothetical protein